MKISRIDVNEIYSTSDLALATAISLWYPLDAIDRTKDTHKAHFLFRRDQQMDELVVAYWRGELKVNPQEYFNALKNLKARLYEDR